jgi:hypothetical protein
LLENVEFFCLFVGNKEAARGRADMLEPADRTAASVLCYVGGERESSQVPRGAGTDFTASLWPMSSLHCVPCR